LLCRAVTLVVTAPTHFGRFILIFAPSEKIRRTPWLKFFQQVSLFGNPLPWEACNLFFIYYEVAHKVHDKMMITAKLSK
jgi:hypothetical protein